MWAGAQTTLLLPASTSRGPAANFRGEAIAAAGGATILLKTWRPQAMATMLLKPAILFSKLSSIVGFPLLTSARIQLLTPATNFRGEAGGPRADLWPEGLGEAEYSSPPLLAGAEILQAASCAAVALLLAA